MERVQLGQHELPVVPQKHARLKFGAKRLGFNSVEDYFVALVIPSGGAERYELLSLAIPALSEKMPRHEWEGFASEAAMDRGEDGYDEDNDPSPDYDQIVAAGHKVIEVNGVGRLGKIVGLLQTMTSLAQQESPESENSTATALASPGSPGE